jgi:hypothetical protein
VAAAFQRNSRRFAMSPPTLPATTKSTTASRGRSAKTSRAVQWNTSPPTVPGAQRLERHRQQFGKLALSQSSASAQISHRTHRYLMLLLEAAVVQRSPAFPAGAQRRPWKGLNGEPRSAVRGR